MEENQEQNLETMIQMEKERICQETGMTLERLEELKIIAQKMMDDIKTHLKTIDDPFERGYVLNIVGDKCTMVSKLNFVSAMKFNEGETEDGESGKEA